MSTARGADTYRATRPSICISRWTRSQEGCRLAAHGQSVAPAMWRRTGALLSSLHAWAARGVVGVHAQVPPNVCTEEQRGTLDAVVERACMYTHATEASGHLCLDEEPSCWKGEPVCYHLLSRRRGVLHGMLCHHATAVRSVLGALSCVDTAGSKCLGRERMGIPLSGSAMIRDAVCKPKPQHQTTC